MASNIHILDRDTFPKAPDLDKPTDPIHNSETAKTAQTQKLPL